MSNHGGKRQGAGRPKGSTGIKWNTQEKLLQEKIKTQVIVDTRENLNVFFDRLYTLIERKVEDNTKRYMDDTIELMMDTAKDDVIRCTKEYKEKMNSLDSELQDIQDIVDELAEYNADNLSTKLVAMDFKRTSLLSTIEMMQENVRKANVHLKEIFSEYKEYIHEEERVRVKEFIDAGKLIAQTFNIEEGTKKAKINAEARAGQQIVQVNAIKSADSKDWD